MRKFMETISNCSKYYKLSIYIDSSDYAWGFYSLREKTGVDIKPSKTFSRQWRWFSYSVYTYSWAWPCLTLIDAFSSPFYYSLSSTSQNRDKFPLKRMCMSVDVEAALLTNESRITMGLLYPDVASKETSHSEKKTQ